MTKYTLIHIPSEKSGRIVTDRSLSESLNITKLENAEKILAAEFYTLGAKKCKRNIENQNNPSYIREQYQEELEEMTKWFLEETPKEFLRLNHFEVIEQ